MTRGPGISVSSVATRVTSLLPWAALLVVAGSLYVAWLNDPGTVRATGMLAVALLAVSAAAFRAVPPVAIGCSATGGAVALALTSRDYFSLWAAGTALLVTAAVSENVRRPFVTVTAALVGVCIATLGPTHDALPALWSVLVAAVLAALVQFTMDWGARAHDLEVRVAAYQQRATESEAAAAELERRSALAQELHDSLTHHVAAIAVQAEAGKVADSHQSLTTITGLAREALKELEVVLFDLKTPNRDIGGGETDLHKIDSKLAQPLRQDGVRVDVTVTTTATNPKLLSTIYRIVQEALTNVLRHAHATTAQVVVHEQENDVIVIVTDDGIGLDQDRAGYGLTGMRTRAAQIGGEVNVMNAVPHGTRVHARFPREHA